MQDDDDYLYHVTYLARIPHIAARGLVPDSATSIGNRAYAKHKQGNVFLTSEDGVFFWTQRIEEWAEHNSDDE